MLMRYLQRREADRRGLVGRASSRNGPDAECSASALAFCPRRELGIAFDARRAACGVALLVDGRGSRWPLPAMALNLFALNRRRVRRRGCHGRSSRLRFGAIVRLLVSVLRRRFWRELGLVVIF